MSWLWLNIPLMAVFFLAVTGIPLWLVFRHPDAGKSGPAAVTARTPRPQQAPATPAPSRQLAGIRR